jgi:adenylate kinase family enzyme
MKLAISGGMCCGKTTIANYLIKKYNYKKFSFADDVKKFAIEIFDIKNKDRELLQNFATKIKEIDDLIWIKRLDKKIKNIDNYIIIDDVRFQNEVTYLKACNFKILKLEIDKDLQFERLKKTYPKDYMKHYECCNHNSEKLINIDYDYYYHINSNTENDIYNFIDNIIFKS